MALVLGTVPAGQVIVAPAPGFVCGDTGGVDCDCVEPVGGDAGFVEPFGVWPVAEAGVVVFALPDGELFTLGRDDCGFAAAPPGCAVAFTGTQVTAPGELGIAVCGVFVFGSVPFCGVVLCVFAGGVVCAPGPAALVVIGVGGPIVVGGGVVFGLAGAAAVGGAAVVGTDVWDGGAGGAVVVRCARAKLHSVKTMSKTESRIFIRKPRFDQLLMFYSSSLKPTKWPGHPVDAVGPSSIRK